MYNKLTSNHYKGFVVTDLSASAEFATCPSSSTLYLGGFGYGGTIKNKKKKGVTVAQVCRKIVDLFNTPSKDDFRGYEFGEYAEFEEPDFGRTCIQMLFLHDDNSPRFEGWLEPATVSAEGVVSLVAAPFSGMDYC